VAYHSSTGDVGKASEVFVLFLFVYFKAHSTYTQETEAIMDSVCNGTRSR